MRDDINYLKRLVAKRKDEKLASRTETIVATWPKPKQTLVRNTISIAGFSAREMIEGLRKTATIGYSLRPTHCGELMREIVKNCPDIEVVKSHYTAGGVKTIFKDKFDNQEYIMVLKPKRGDK